MASGTLQRDLARLREDIAQVRRAVPEPKPSSPPVTDPFMVAAVAELRRREADWQARSTGPAATARPAAGPPPPAAEGVWLARECYRRLRLEQGMPEPFEFEEWHEGGVVRDGGPAPVKAAWPGRTGPTAGSPEDQLWLERVMEAAADRAGSTTAYREEVEGRRRGGWDVVQGRRMGRRDPDEAAVGP